MTDIISAIDSATGCHQCGNPLGSSPSSDFCSEFCQSTWLANRIGTAATDPRSIPTYVTMHSMDRPEPHPNEQDFRAAIRALYRGV